MDSILSSRCRRCTLETSERLIRIGFLMGGIDVSQLLPFGTEAEVRQTVRKTIDEAGAKGRYWIGSTTEIHPAAKLENVLAMWDEIEKHGYYE